MDIKEGTKLVAIKDYSDNNGNKLLRKGLVYRVDRDYEGNLCTINEVGNYNYWGDWGDFFTLPEETLKSDGGGGQNYYDLPPNPEQLQDLIEYRNMNGNIKNIFKAAYRMGHKESIDDEYDLKKIIYFSVRELGRQRNSREFTKIALEVFSNA